MFVNFDFSVFKNKIIGVATSGGSDSMALLHYMLSIKDKFFFKVIALNVEHGIRGESSIADSLFVKDYCEKLNIPLLSYSVDAVSHSKENKLSIEQSARILRYECFQKAISDGNCDFIATAHHQKDNAETILINLFRGTGLKGATGISNFDGKIIRPLLNTEKKEILSYLQEFSVPFVTDESNFSSDYTRNYLRLNVIPLIEKVFPEYDKSLNRFSSLVKEEDEFLDRLSQNAITKKDNGYYIDLDTERVLFKRACIIAFKALGIEKDWEKVHVDGVLGLKDKENGAKVCLPKGVFAIREYQNAVIYKEEKENFSKMPFNECVFNILDNEYEVKRVEVPKKFNGLFIDGDKIPKGAIIRTKGDGDIFTKFGGGTKKLVDYFTDKKIPCRLRSSIPVIAVDNEILAIFGVEVSEKVRVDKNTKVVYQLVKK